MTSSFLFLNLFRTGKDIFFCLNFILLFIAYIFQLRIIKSHCINRSNKRMIWLAPCHELFRIILNRRKAVTCGWSETILTMNYWNSDNFLLKYKLQPVFHSWQAWFPLCIENQFNRPNHANGNGNWNYQTNSYT